MHGQCGRFTGTSATAPMAAGVLAMALQAKYNMTTNNHLKFANWYKNVLTNISCDETTRLHYFQQ